MCRRLQEAGITRVDDPIERVYQAGESSVGVRTIGAATFHFDSLYAALGCVMHSELATASLGARCADDRSIEVDDHQRTSVPGLYAVGDVVSRVLNQITVAAGQAATAAVAIHNSLPLSAWQSRSRA